MEPSIKHMEKVVAAEPGNLPALRKLAQLYFRREQYDKAVWCLHRAMDIDPGNAEICGLLGFCFRQGRLYHEAYNYYIRAIELGGDKTEIWGLLGAICRQRRQTEEARRFLQQAYDNGNRESGTLICMAEERHIDGQIEEALALASDAYARTPENIFFKLVVESLSVRLENLNKNPAGAANQRRIALHLNRPFHYSIMKPIFEALKQNYHVIMTGDPMWVRDFDPDYIFVADAQSVQLREVVPNAKYVYTRHGLISKNFAYDVAGQCDYVCLSSPYLARQYEEEGGFDADRLWIVGYSQMDALFNVAPLVIDEAVDEGEKTILYAPTYNDALSSVPLLGPDFVDKIRGAGDATNIIIKPHPIIYQHSPDWMNWFRQAAQSQKNVFLIEGEASNIMPYLKNADLLLSDASSVVFQYLAMDRPIVLINNPAHRKSRYYDENGIEWKWRDMAVEVSDMADLQAAVEDGLANPGARKEKREIYAGKLFGDLRNGETGLNIKAKLDALYEASERYTNEQQ